jgi:hypothetical protein
MAQKDAENMHETENMHEQDLEQSQNQGTQHSEMRVPQGFTVHSSGLASEYARELGWGINEEERKKTPKQKQDYDGGRNYDYGARDFGDTAQDTSSAESTAERNRPRHTRQRKSAA